MKNPWSALIVLVSLLAGCVHAPAPDGPGPFDEAADARSQVTNAIAEAHTLDRNVLLVFGANWCSDSRATLKLFETDPSISKLLDASFVVERIDVGPKYEDRNDDLVEQYHAATYEGIPVLVVLGPSGELLNDTRQERLADDDHERPGLILQFLEKHSPVHRGVP